MKKHLKLKINIEGHTDEGGDKEKLNKLTKEELKKLVIV
jgi:hypothetical protein